MTTLVTHVGAKTTARQQAEFLGFLTVNLTVLVVAPEGEVADLPGPMVVHHADSRTILEEEQLDVVHRTPLFVRHSSLEDLTKLVPIEGVTEESPLDKLLLGDLPETLRHVVEPTKGSFMGLVLIVSRVLELHHGTD